MSDVKASPVSYLFVPASRPDRFEKALGTNADAVIIDLEDAVPADEKGSALEHLTGALETGLSRPAYVRINAADSEWFERDLESLSALTGRARASLAGVVLAKAESGAEIAKVASAIHPGGGENSVIALIESARGVAAIREIAATSGLERFAVGAADLSFDLDVEIESPTIDWVYAQLVVESRLAGLEGPIASPPFEITDADAVRRDATRMRALGATAQLSIHPSQLSAIHEGFAPSEASVEWALRVVEAARASDGATKLDGQMIDKPIVERAERVLSRRR